MLVVLLIISILLIAFLYWKIASLDRLLKKRLTEIERLERRGSDFVANVSHELKTPLTVIKGYAETLRHALKKDQDKAESFLDRIEENTERLSLLINDILDLSRIESPNPYVEKEVISVDKFFQQLKDQFSVKLSKKNQVLVFNSAISSGGQHLTADPRLCEQAVSNLIENAHRYCQDGALIEVKCFPLVEGGERWTCIQVSDNGPGISKEDLPRIFERFYRADKSRNRSLGGTGLGLAIVKHIMLSHGGQARAESKNGASFRLLFPDESI